MAKESCSRYKRSVRRNKSETAAMTKVPSKIRPPVPLIPYVRPQPQSFVVVNPVSFDKLMSKLNEVESRPARLAECNLNVSSMWICALCQKSSNVDGLGDLYGPYLAELAKMNWHFSDIPILSSKSDVKLGKKRLSVESINGDDSHYSVDVWFHGSCALWSPSLLLDRFTIDRLVEQLADAWRQVSFSDD